MRVSGLLFISVCSFYFFCLLIYSSTYFFWYQCAVVEIVCTGHDEARRMHTRNAHCVPLVVVESMHRKWQADRSPHTLRLMPALRAMTPAPAMGAARKSDKPVRRGRRRKLPAFLRAQPAPPPRALAAALASSGDCVGTAAADTTAVADPPGLGKISKAPRPARRRAPGATHAAPQREATKRAAWRTTVPLSIPFGEVYAVSLQQPWASAVVAGAQPIVNRSVKLAIPPGLHSGVWLAVHADQATDECARCMEGADPALAARAARFPAMRSPLDLPRGRLIGAMRVVRCVALENRNALGADAAPWADGPLCWFIDRSVAVGRRGCLGRSVLHFFCLLFLFAHLFFCLLLVSEADKTERASL